MLSLTSPRHISTLPIRDIESGATTFRFESDSDRLCWPSWVPSVRFRPTSIVALVLRDGRGVALSARASGTSTAPVGSGGLKV